MLRDKFPNIEALSKGTVSGRISEWPRLGPEARAILVLLDEMEQELQGYYKHCG